jgi:hypothetical protein
MIRAWPGGQSDAARNIRYGRRELAGTRPSCKDSVARRFHFVDKLQDEFEPIEQTFDASARHLWNGIAVRLAQRSQLIASITPQGSKSLYAQCRKNAIDLVDDRPSFAG